MSRSNQSRTGAASSSTSATTAKLLRGGSFVQPNTATAPAAVLQNVELHAEDLHALTRSSTVMLRPTILLWRKALDDVAKEIQTETKKPLDQIAPSHPATIRIIDFKPPPPVTFKGIHRVDGDLQFQWQDRDAAVGGVYQPKVVVGRGGGGNDDEEEHNSKNSSASSKPQQRDEVDYSAKQRKLWQPHELAKKDKFAWELLREYWRDSARQARKDMENKAASLQLQQQQQQSKNDQQQEVDEKPKMASSAEEHRQRIRQREEDEAAAKNKSSTANKSENEDENDDEDDGPKRPPNSSVLAQRGVTRFAAAPQTSTTGAKDDDVEAILRRAQEALGI